MRTLLASIAAVFLSVIAGCASTTGGGGSASSDRAAPKQENVLLTVDFQPAQTLQYKFVSSREVVVDWDPQRSQSPSARKGVSKHSESMEMVVSYAPVEVDPFGISTIKATCSSVKVSRTGLRGARAGARDAVESFRGKTFALAVDARGKIKDYSQLDELIREAGKKAFREDTSRGRIKEPDMIGDFIASQWFLWDSISSIEEPSEGLAVGQMWRSKLSVPTPMVMRKARTVSYTLEEVRQSQRGNLAIISCSYEAADSAPRSWPVPYYGRFQMSGTFGFLGGYEVTSLAGKGEEVFNIDLGQMEKYDQRYKVQIKAALPPIGIKAKPQITIDQRLTMELLSP